MSAGKQLTKTQLLRQSHARTSSPYTNAGGRRSSTPKGCRRAADPNDYSQKFAHGPLWVRDQERPFIHYHTQYTPEVDLFLLRQLTDSQRESAATGVDHPPRWSAIRTTTHPTHRMLGNDVKTFHLLKDSGFRYQEKFPHCLRLCLSGMGQSGSSNRPYALSARDFAHHFQSISLAYRGRKKAKLCLYEKAAHRPRVDWLRQLVPLVFGEAPYDAARYEVRELAFNGSEFVDPSGRPQRPQPTIRALPTIQPSHSTLLRCDEVLDDDEEAAAAEASSSLGDSKDDDLSDTETVVQQEDASQEPHQRLLQPLASGGWPTMKPPSHDSQETLLEEEEEEPEEDTFVMADVFAHPLLLSGDRALARGFSSLPSGASFASPLVASPSGGLTFSPSIMMRQTSNPPAATPTYASEHILDPRLQLMPAQSTASQFLASHFDSRLDSVGFDWLNSRTESITNDTRQFLAQQHHHHQQQQQQEEEPTRGHSCALAMPVGNYLRINSCGEYFNQQ